MAAVLCPTLAHCLKSPLALYLKISPLFYLGFSWEPLSHAQCTPPGIHLPGGSSAPAIRQQLIRLPKPTLKSLAGATGRQRLAQLRQMSLKVSLRICLLPSPDATDQTPGRLSCEESQ